MFQPLWTQIFHYWDCTLYTLYTMISHYCLTYQTLLWQRNLPMAYHFILHIIYYYTSITSQWCYELKKMISSCREELWAALRQTNTNNQTKVSLADCLLPAMINELWYKWMNLYLVYERSGYLWRIQQLWSCGSLFVSVRQIFMSKTAIFFTEYVCFCFSHLWDQINNVNELPIPYKPRIWFLSSAVITGFCYKTDLVIPTLIFLVHTWGGPGTKWSQNWDLLTSLSPSTSQYITIH